MEDLTFRLDGIPASKGSTIDFEGPLTLILQLLSKNRIEIKDVSISQILDQYMSWLEEMKAMDLEVATEFVTMASHLVYIKARSLLNEDKPIEEMQELVSSLELLKAKAQWENIKDVTRTLDEMFREGSGQIGKNRSPLPNTPFHNEPEEVSSLIKALRAAFELSEDDLRTAANKPVPMPTRISYPIDAASERILRLLNDEGGIGVHFLFDSAESRSEIVALFLAVLELASDGKLVIQGIGSEAVLSGTSLPVTEEENESA